MPTGGSWLSSRARTIRVDFDYTSSSPVFVALQAANEDIVEADVVVTTDFDDLAATAALGTPSTPGLIFDTTEIKLARVGQAHSEEAFEVASPTTIQLTLAPGASTQGAGYVLIQLQGV